MQSIQTLAVAHLIFLSDSPSQSSLSNTNYSVALRWATGWMIRGSSPGRGWELFTTTSGLALRAHSGGLLGPRAVVDAVVKRKIHSPHRESKPRTTIFQPVAQRYTD
jgi:hypothetical protein